jgi:hypothetical protein
MFTILTKDMVEQDTHFPMIRAYTSPWLIKMTNVFHRGFANNTSKRYAWQSAFDYAAAFHTSDLRQRNVRQMFNALAKKYNKGDNPFVKEAFDLVRLQTVGDEHKISITNAQPDDFATFDWVNTPFALGMKDVQGNKVVSTIARNSLSCPDQVVIHAYGHTDLPLNKSLITYQSRGELTQGHLYPHCLETSLAVGDLPDSEAYATNGWFLNNNSAFSPVIPIRWAHENAADIGLISGLYMKAWPYIGGIQWDSDLGTWVLATETYSQAHPLYMDSFYSRHSLSEYGVADTANRVDAMIAQLFPDYYEMRTVYGMAWQSFAEGRRNAYTIFTSSDYLFNRLTAAGLSEASQVATFNGVTLHNRKGRDIAFFYDNNTKPATPISTPPIPVSFVGFETGRLVVEQPKSRMADNFIPLKKKKKGK